MISIEDAKIVLSDIDGIRQNIRELTRDSIEKLKALRIYAKHIKWDLDISSTIDSKLIRMHNDYRKIAYPDKYAMLMKPKK